jgi:glycosyltransferase involved in cell wall biosynthesis
MIAEKGLAEVSLMYDFQLATDQALESAIWADMTVLHRPASEEWFKFIKLMQKNGKFFVADYDDNPFKTSPLTPFYRYHGTENVEYVWPDGKREWLWHEDMVSPSGKKIFDIERNIHYLETFRANFRKADMVTTTTEELAEEFRKINPNTIVLPNLINPTWFPKIPEMVKKEVRIVWQGAAGHYEDLFFLQPIITKILEKHDNVKFVFFGDFRFRKLFDKCDQNKIEFHSWVNLDAYPYKLSLLNGDIGLCPLIDNEFNRNKSAIKWMEYSMVGMATVASNIPPYSKVIESGKTGILCNENDKEWEDAIKRLIKNKTERWAISCQAKDEVMTNHNLEKKLHLWVDAYESILNPKASMIK